MPRSCAVMFLITPIISHDYYIDMYVKENNKFPVFWTKTQ